MSKIAEGYDGVGTFDGVCIADDQLDAIERGVWYRHFNGGSNRPLYIMVDAAEMVHMVEWASFNGDYDSEVGRHPTREAAMQAAEKHGTGQPLDEYMAEAEYYEWAAANA